MESQSSHFVAHDLHILLSQLAHSTKQSLHCVFLQSGHVLVQSLHTILSQLLHSSEQLSICTTPQQESDTQSVQHAPLQTLQSTLQSGQILSKHLVQLAVKQNPQYASKQSVHVLSIHP